MPGIRTISIDIETFSDVDLSKCGVYKYCESPSFEILLFGYAANGGEAHVIDLAQGEEIPREILDALTDGSVTKWAFNANFERVCLSRYLCDRGASLDPDNDARPPSGECARFLSPKGWRCSMVWSACMGLPLSLKGVGSALGLEDQKMDEGKALIKYFSVPCAATAANAGRTRNLPPDDPERWELFKAYNRRDVEAEMAVQEVLARFPVPESVWEEYEIDQEINDRGVRVDMGLVRGAIGMDERSRGELTSAMREVTRLDNPNSVQQMKGWLADNGLEMGSLGKKEVAAAIETAPEELREVLELRLQLAKSSVRKYQAMESAACGDGRARGMFQFCGASRTGRWAGRLIQLQNLPQNHLPDLAEARELVKSGDYESVKMLYGDVPDTLSQLVRTAFVPREGCKFIVADFSAIEARVLAWLAGEAWRQEVFDGGGDIYCASASQMFHVPVEKHGVNGHLRQKGKIAELALGYGGSVGALKAMGALEMGLPEGELQPLVDAWRASNPNIVRFWWEVDGAATRAVRERGSGEARGIRFSYEGGFLLVTLPSGRRLAYARPRVGTNQFGGECVTYEGVGGTKKWERLGTYGPKLVENIVQATSRDILCHAMRTLRHCRIVMHIHDELVIEAGPDMSAGAVCEQMGRTPPWAPGLRLRADGYECDFYQKD